MFAGGRPILLQKTGRRAGRVVSQPKHFDAIFLSACRCRFSNNRGGSGAAAAFGRVSRDGAEPREAGDFAATGRHIGAGRSCSKGGNAIFVSGYNRRVQVRCCHIARAVRSPLFEYAERRTGDHGWDIDLNDGSSNNRIYDNLVLNGGIKLRERFFRTLKTM